LVSDERVKEKEFLAVFRTTKKDAETTKRVTALEEHWSSEARKNYLRAADLAQQAAALAK
jgi:hypothetical protein